MLRAWPSFRLLQQDFPVDCFGEENSNASLLLSKVDFYGNLLQVW